MKGQNWNAVFFPHNEHSFADPTKFIVFSNLLTGEACESAEDSDFNSGEYPRSDSEPLTKAIINTAFSQINSSGSHFSVMLGDAVCGTDFQNEYRDFYNTALHLEIPMFAVPGDRDVHTNGARIEHIPEDDAYSQGYEPEAEQEGAAGNYRS